jgi:hypothetical protein
MVAKPANAFLLATSGVVEFCDTAATSSDFCREENSVVAGVLSPSAFLATETVSGMLRGVWSCRGKQCERRRGGDEAGVRSETGGEQPSVAGDRRQYRVGRIRACAA